MQQAGCERHPHADDSPCGDCAREERADLVRFRVMIALIAMFAVYSIFLQPK
jgi:hypothetical protein